MEHVPLCEFDCSAGVHGSSLKVRTHPHFSIYIFICACQCVFGWERVRALLITVECCMSFLLVISLALISETWLLDLGFSSAGLPRTEQFLRMSGARCLAGSDRKGSRPKGGKAQRRQNLPGQPPGTAQGTPWH